MTEIMLKEKEVSEFHISVFTSCGVKPDRRRRFVVRYRIGKGKKWYYPKVDKNATFTIPKWIVKRFSSHLGTHSITIDMKYGKLLPQHTQTLIVETVPVID